MGGSADPHGYATCATPWRTGRPPDTMTQMLRRPFLVLVLALVVFPAAAGVGSPALRHNRAWQPQPGLPLTEPEQLYSENGVLEVTFTPRNRVIEVSGSEIHARPYTDDLVAPTLHVSPGDSVSITIKSRIKQITNVHWHGLHVSPQANGDNVFRAMAPGTTSTSTVEIPEDHWPGTNWYHVHWHGTTVSQNTGGMAGLIVVEGLEDRLPAELQDITQRQLALRDVHSNGDRIVMAAGKLDPAQPTTRLVNGLLLPELSLAPGETQLWRIANVGANIYYDIALEGHEFHVLAEDGFPAWEVWSADHLLMPPGKRFDVLVQGGESGSYELETLHYDEGYQLLPKDELATVTVTGVPQLPAVIPTTMNDRDRELTDATVDGERRFKFDIVFDGDDVSFTVNGKVFNHHEKPVVASLGTVEEWTLVNPSTEDHPFHIHQNPFQVMSVNGEPQTARGLQDIVNIPKKGEVVIRNPFLDYTGKYVFHCHILDHEDGGMMKAVKIR